jgi:hypothetical protein
MPTPHRTLAVALILAAAPATALAQAPPPQAPAALNPVAREADQLFQEGRAALKKGDLPRAADRFERSQELDPSPGTLLNLAEVYEHLGKLVKALDLFEHARKQLPDTDDRYPVARDGIARVKPRIPTLRLNLAAGSPVQMAVRIDGAPVAISSLGADQAMDPGSYNVTTSAPGHEERSYDVVLKESGNVTVTVEAGKKTMVMDAPQRSLPPPPPGRPPVLQTAGFAALGVGATGLVLGAVTGILAIVQKGDASTLCPQPSRCTGPGLTASGTGHALAAVSTGAFVVGLAGAGAGVAMVLLGRDPRPAGSDAAPRPPVAAVTPWVLPGGAGLGVLGRF